MPELPQMQASQNVSMPPSRARPSTKVELLGFSGLKTVLPPGQGIEGEKVQGVGRRGKYLVLALSSGRRVLIHLSQAGRLDIEVPSKQTRPRGGVVRFVLGNGTGVLVREHGHERKAGWWVLASRCRRTAGGSRPGAADTGVRGPVDYEPGHSSSSHPVAGSEFCCRHRPRLCGRRAEPRQVVTLLFTQVTEPR